MKPFIRTFTLIFLILTANNILGQETKSYIKYLGIESSLDYQSSSTIEFDFIRADNSVFGLIYNQRIASYFNKWSLGLKIEFEKKESNFTFASGIRYTGFNSGIYEDSQKSYFNLLNKQYETTTEYLRIEEITQQSGYIGIPFEAKYLININDILNFFMKAGADINFKLNTTNDVFFVNEEMEEFTEEVMDKFNDPDKFFGSIYLTEGIRIGKKYGPNLNLELKLPVFNISKQLSSFHDTYSFGIGGQIGILIPLN